MKSTDIPFSSNQSENISDPKLQHLVQDIRSLQKISAPENFEQLLAQRIRDSHSIRLPWYKRLFIPQIDGGFAFPVYAYSSIATIAVVVIGYYVISTTINFEQHDMTVPTSIQSTSKTNGNSNFQPPSQPEFRQGTTTSNKPETKSEDARARGNQFKSDDHLSPESTPPNSDVGKDGAPNVSIQAVPVNPSGQSATVDEKSASKKPPTPMKLEPARVQEEKDVLIQSRGISEPEEAGFETGAKAIVSDSLRRLDSLLKVKRDSLTHFKKK